MTFENQPGLNPEELVDIASDAATAAEGMETVQQEMHEGVQEVPPSTAEEVSAAEEAAESVGASEAAEPVSEASETPGNTETDDSRTPEAETPAAPAAVPGARGAAAEMLRSAYEKIRQERRLQLAAGAAGLALLAAVVLLGRFGVQQHQKTVALRAERQHIAEVTEPYADTDVILPNVSIGGTAVGGLTAEEALSTLMDAVCAEQVHTINAVLPDRTLSFSTELPELEADAEAAVEQAVAYGRDDLEPAALCSAVEQAASGSYEIPFSTASNLDEEAIRSSLAATAEECLVEPVQSTVDINTEELYIAVTMGTPGHALDAEGLGDAILKGFEAEDYRDIVFDYTILPVDEIPLETLYSRYSWEPGNATYNPETQDVEPDYLGYAPDIELEEALNTLAALQSGEQAVFPFHAVEAYITEETLRNALFRDTLYSYGSPYTSDSNRTENLRLACEAINGTVIQPGEVFSFNDTVGQRTAEKGYRTAIVYVNGQSEPQTGGGICQVASTIYYCCLYAELEIVQREPHMFKVTYVPNGMDATVYWGSLDYCFRNNTYFPIKINAYLSGGCCWIELVGTDIYHHKVEMESVALSSLSYRVYRYVYAQDGSLIKEEDLGVSSYSAHN